MTITWDSKADAKLMSAFTQTGSVDYDAVAKYMGDGCTVSAVKHRIARLRDKAGISNLRGGRKAPGTPKKGGAGSNGPDAGTSAGSSSKDGSTHSLTGIKKNGPATPTGRRKRAGSFGPIHGGRGMKSDSKASGSETTDADDEETQREEEGEAYFEG
ncbi:hypothetical protein N7478_010443 [Penicillium angulare]|uniref:uncharacterized protein n=1 Tax=Penicillium angulare TaxID=116970 RepID=UPI0025417BCB|nr:uncharacterized protein N7478_010443 [Penicillium angulare]KAJ5267635.1 hypothetical protein N7478_010443 [Penicillium angulare]